MKTNVTVQPSGQKQASLIRSTLTVTSMSLISRVLGFMRDLITAQTFGAGAGFDAFVVAFKIPNFLRRLFAEGAFSQAFVPVLTSYQQSDDPDAVRAFIARVTGTLFSALLAVTLLMILLAPVLITVFAPGFYDEPARFNTASSLLRLTSPYLLCLSLVALASGVLNTYGYFAVPAVTPVLLNVSLITATLWVAPHLTHPVYALGGAVLVAGVLQLLFQLPFLRRLQLLPKPTIAWRDPGVQRVLRIMLPALYGTSVTQIGLLMDTLFASFLMVGSVTWLYYAERLMSFPLGLFGIAIATVLLPRLSKEQATRNEDGFNRTLDWAIRMILLVGIPSAMGLIVLAGPLLVCLFHYGRFGDYDVYMAAQSLMMFALGLPAFMLVKVLSVGFFAKEDAKTPMKIATVAIISNLILNTLLIQVMAHSGLALATSLAATLNAGLLMALLKRQGIFIPQPGWLLYLRQLGAATLAMTIVVYSLSVTMTQWLRWGVLTRFGHLSVLIGSAILIYCGVLYAMGLRWRSLSR